jgi:hypothetical protein
MPKTMTRAASPTHTNLLTTELSIVTARVPVGRAKVAAFIMRQAAIPLSRKTFRAPNEVPMLRRPKIAGQLNIAAPRDQTYEQPAVTTEVAAAVFAAQTAATKGMDVAARPTWRRVERNVRARRVSAAESPGNVRGKSSGSSEFMKPTYSPRVPTNAAPRTKKNMVGPVKAARAAEGEVEEKSKVPSHTREATAADFWKVTHGVSEPFHDHIARPRMKAEVGVVRMRVMDVAKGTLKT